ncbi:MAG: hypothetical protein AB7T74_04020 [Clostridia bacterium]|jgi:hypothetical protein
MPAFKQACLALIILAVMVSGSAMASPLKPEARTIRFSKQNWQVIHSGGLRGPGPNVFDARNVYLDEQGRLVMETAFRDGLWTSAHVFLSRSLGYGTYKLVLAPMPKALDVLTVFGFFTWDDNPAFANREIDIELARWGHTTAPNLNFTVQPWDGYPERQNNREFDFSSRATLEFEWQPDGIRFKATSSLGFAEWYFPEPDSSQSAPFVVPPKGRERLGLNLWLFQGREPEAADRIVIEEFRFTRWTGK